jgi:predicted Zn-dependent protease
LERKTSDLEIKDAANDVIWDAAHEYEGNISAGLGLAKEEQKELFTFFSKEQPARFQAQDLKMEDIGTLEHTLQKVCLGLAHPKIRMANAMLNAVKENQFYINSEGSQVFTSDVRYSLYLTVSTVDKKNYIIPHGCRFLIKDFSKLPDYDQLMESGERLIKEVLEIAQAPVQGNGAFPAILDPENHGVLWHEVIGHALEGHRMQEDEWGEVTTLFRDSIGKQVAPTFLSLYDDPTDSSMWGHYLYDAEGVPAQKVTLIDNGILKGYLHSRESAGFFETSSNGHARNEGNSDPVPRMSNIKIVSGNAVPFGELKEHMMKLCRDKGKEYGLVLRESHGGLTIPEESFYKTVPTHVFRIYADGREERVRGIYVVGTPHQTLQNIVQTSDEYGTFDGYCGAESGSVPSAEKAPDALVSSLEINRLPKDSYRQLPVPII